ncbi:MAG: hypothetical protein AAB270_06820 [Chloroflexota bacterium]
MTKMKHKYPPPEGWFACNIPDIKRYIRSLTEQVGGPLTPERLKIAIDEDSFGEVSIEECRELLSKYAP